jgi:hypothetical protein
MSINGVGGTASANQFVPLELDGAFTSVAGQLAGLMLESEETHKQLDRENLVSARHDYAAALADEVDALREQADAARTGAIVEGSIGLASGALGVWGSARECDELKNPWQGPAASGLGKLASPLGAYVSHNYGAADAKAAAGAREQASWEMDDARQNIKDADAAQDKALDWVSSLIGQDAAVTSAILSNKA